MDEYAKAAIEQAVEAGTLDTGQLQKFIIPDSSGHIAELDDLPAHIRDQIAAMMSEAK